MDTDQEVEAFLEHVGVKGMKWGQRRQAKAQGRINAVKKVASGSPTKKDSRVAAQIGAGGLTKSRREKKAKKILADTANAQNKIKAGKMKTFEMLNKLAGVSIADLNLD